MQKVLVMNSEACSLLQLCNSEQNVTTWSSAVAQQWFPKVAVDQGISRINDTLSALQCSTLAAALGWHVRSAPPVAPKHDWEHPCVLSQNVIVQKWATVVVSVASKGMLSGARFPLLRMILFSDTGCCRGRKDCGSEAVKALERDTRASFVRAHGRSSMSRIRKKTDPALGTASHAAACGHIARDGGIARNSCVAGASTPLRKGWLASERGCLRATAHRCGETRFRESQSRFQRQITEAAVRPESSDSERYLVSISISIDGVRPIADFSPSEMKYGYVELFEKVVVHPVPANSVSSCFFRGGIVGGSCVRTLHWK